jgi:toluene monooxygenase electron transfer component
MPEITITDSGTSFSCAPDDTILRAALRSGLGFPYECNVGSCGNCRFELVEGKVVHQRESPPAWNERDKQHHRYLGCQASPLGDCRIKVNLEGSYRSRHRPRRTRGRFLETFGITHDMNEFRLALAEPAPFLPGQYALLYLPGVNGPRAFSMCNVSPEGSQWHFQVKRVPHGAASTVLFEVLQPGDSFGVDGPYGTAYLREDSRRDILCLAGGAGLPPMLSITRAAAVNRALAGREIHFVYGGRGARDICGEPMLRELPGFGSRIHYYPCVSRPNDPEGGGWEGRCGLIHDVARELFGDRLREFEIYFAGPAAMAKAMLRMLHDMKVPLEQVHFDEFY